MLHIIHRRSIDKVAVRLPRKEAHIKGYLHRIFKSSPRPTVFQLIFTTTKEFLTRALKEIRNTWNAPNNFK